MVNFVVSTPSLGFSAATMTDAAAMLDMQIQQAQGVISAVVGGTWTGEAADKFLEEWQGFVASAALTRTALISIATRLQAAQSTYEVTESQLVTAAGSARVTITQPGRDGRVGTADDERTAVTLEESIDDSSADLTGLDADIAEWGGGVQSGTPSPGAGPNGVELDGNGGG